MNGIARVGVTGLASTVCLGELLEPPFGARVGNAGRKAAMALEPDASKD